MEMPAQNRDDPGRGLIDAARDRQRRVHSVTLDQDLIVSGPPTP